VKGLTLQQRREFMQQVRDKKIKIDLNMD